MRRYAGIFGALVIGVGLFVWQMPDDATVTSGGYDVGYAGGYVRAGFTGGYAVGGTESPCTNEMVNSWEFESVAWNGVSANCTVTPGQADPFSTSRASVLASATGTSAYGEIATIVAVTADDFVYGFRVKNNNMADGQRTFARVRHSSGDFGQFGVLWTGTVPSLSAGDTGGTGSLAGDVTYGIINLGADWYYIWLSLDLSAGDRYGDYTPSILPWGPGVTVGQSIVAAGVQLEFDVTEPCGTYTETP